MIDEHERLLAQVERTNWWLAVGAAGCCALSIAALVLMLWWVW